jgi:hypothetical protein
MLNRAVQGMIYDSCQTSKQLGAALYAGFLARGHITIKIYFIPCTNTNVCPANIRSTKHKLRNKKWAQEV